MKIGSDQWKRTLIDGAAALGAPLDEDGAEAFALHARELMLWNKKISLTTITDPLEVAVKHFLDSVAAFPLLPDKGRMLDIGAGGGFPGIPLKVLAPSLDVTLIDASRKKANFMKYVIRSLSLTRIDAHHARAESLARDPSHHHSYDVIICRALASLKDFIPMALPLLKRDGALISLKGPSCEEEIAAIAPPGPGADSPGRIQDRFALTTHRFKLPHIKDPRAIVVIKT